MRIKLLSLNHLPGFLFLFVISFACSPNRQLAKSAKNTLINAGVLNKAHIGITLYEPATNKYWFDYQGDKYFVPASNTKIPTCYAAMKWLGDSLVGLKYGFPEENILRDNITVIIPTGDPTFLHEDFKNHPAYNFILNKSRSGKQLALLIPDSRLRPWGSGWGWTDYQEDYMAERSVFPIYGNIVSIKYYPSLHRFVSQNSFFDSIINSNPGSNQLANNTEIPMVRIDRALASNQFTIEKSSSKFSPSKIPFVTANGNTAISLLQQILQKPIVRASKGNGDEYKLTSETGEVNLVKINKWEKIYSQPTDSMLSPMMHRSDNFFAEQSLLMVSNEILGYMSDRQVIDTLLKTSFADLPQVPTWVDGSGLSRYNLFSPRDLVAILNKMQAEFGMDRVKVIFPTGGEGTISSYYKADSGYLFAKTGTLTGVVALSGFFTTKKNKLLIFSVLVNNHRSGATEVRRAVEKFLQGVRNKY